jgi:broad specificity phosphatase PhoE
MTREQIEEKLPGEHERKQREGLYHYRPFGGENHPDIELRIHSFLQELRWDFAGQKVLVVTHGHWLILLQRILQRLSIEESIQRYRSGFFQNASITVYRAKEESGRTKLSLELENFVA